MVSVRNEQATAASRRDWYHLGHIETTLLKPDGKILSGRLDQAARENIELWMRDAGLPIDE